MDSNELRLIFKGNKFSMIYFYYKIDREFVVEVFEKIQIKKPCIFCKAFLIPNCMSNYLTNRSSLYFGNGQSSLSTVSSNLSM